MSEVGEFKLENSLNTNIKKKELKTKRLKERTIKNTKIKKKIHLLVFLVEWDALQKSFNSKTWLSLNFRNWCSHN